MLLDSTNLTQGTAIGSTLLGVAGAATAPNIQALGLSIVAMVGGLLSVAMTAYGSYRKINKEYGIDEIKAANTKLDSIQKDAEVLRAQNQHQNNIIAQQSSELLELIKTQNQLLLQLNKSSATTATQTTVAAGVAVQQASKI